MLRRLPKSCRPCSQQLLPLPQRGSKNYTAGTVLWTEGYGRVWYWCHKLNLRLQQIKGFLQGCYRLKKLEMFRLQSVSSHDCHCNRAAIKACAWESTLGKFWSTTNGVLTPCTYCFSLSGETFTKACRPWLKSYENVIHLASQIWPYWPGYEWNTPKPSHSKPLVDLKKGQLRTRSSTVTLVRGSICCPKFIMQLALPMCYHHSDFHHCKVAIYEACPSPEHSLSWSINCATWKNHFDILINLIHQNLLTTSTLRQAAWSPPSRRLALCFP